MHVAPEGDLGSNAEPRRVSQDLSSDLGSLGARSDEKVTEVPKLHPSKRLTPAPPPGARRNVSLVESKVSKKKVPPPPPSVGGPRPKQYSTLPKGFSNTTLNSVAPVVAPSSPRISDPKPPPPPAAPFVATSYPPVVPRKNHQRAQSQTNAVTILEKKLDPMARTASEDARPLVMKTAAAPSPPYQAPEFSTFLPVSTMPEDIQQLGSVPISWAFHKRLGHGSSSDVFLVTDRTRYCDLAVKAFAIGDDDHNRMIRQEMDLMLRCKHPNIVNVGPNSCFQSHYGEFFMAMEMCDAGPLSETLSRAREPPTEAIAAYIIECLLLALNFLHSKKIVHRDVKAANILLTTDGKVKLSDFGVAVQVSRPPARPRRSSDTYMRTYLSPSSDHLAPSSYMSLPVTPVAASQSITSLPSPKFERKQSNSSISITPASPRNPRTASQERERRNFVFASNGSHTPPDTSPTRAVSPEPQKRCTCGSALPSPDSSLCDQCKLRQSTELTPDPPPVGKRLKSSASNSLAVNRVQKSRASSMTLPSKKKLAKRSSNTNIVMPANLPQLDSEEDSFATASDLSAVEEEHGSPTKQPSSTTSSPSKQASSPPPKEPLPRRTLSPSPEQREIMQRELNPGPPRRSLTPTPEQTPGSPPSIGPRDSHNVGAVGRSKTLRKHHRSTPSYDMNGVQAGSLPWMSPEALKFFAPCFPMDVWAVGITAIHLARLKVPYTGLVRTEITRRILVSQLVPSLDNDDGIPDPATKWSPEFHDFVSQCLQLEVSKRSTVKQLLNHPFIRKNHTGQCPPDFSYWIAYGRFDKKSKGGQPEQLPTIAHRMSLAAKRASGLKNPSIVAAPTEPTMTPRHRRHRQSNGLKSILTMSNLAENALQSLAQLARDIAEADNDEGPRESEAVPETEERKDKVPEDKPPEPTSETPSKPKPEVPSKPKPKLSVFVQEGKSLRTKVDSGSLTLARTNSTEDITVDPELSDGEIPSPVLEPLSDPAKPRLSEDAAKAKGHVTDHSDIRKLSDDSGPFKPKLSLGPRFDDGPVKPKLSLGLDNDDSSHKPKLTLDSLENGKPKLALEEPGPTKPKLSLGDPRKRTTEMSEMTILSDDDSASDECEELSLASPSNSSSKGLPYLEGTFDMNQTFTADKDGFVAHGFHIGTEGITQQETPEPDGPAAMDLPLRKEDLVHLRVIGRGQNGTVSKTFHLRSLCYLALKTMNAFDKSSRHQLLRELRAFAAFNSPFILRFMGAFYDEGEIVLALEYMERGSLQHLVKKRGPMPAHYLKVVANSMANGLAVLHSARKVHRDIKPDNALMDKNGIVKLADFGLLKDLSEEEKCSTFLGTMLYLSPERATSQQYSYPADVWSLGVTLIFCATGAVPLPPNDYWGLVKQITTFSEQLFPASLCETTNNISPLCRDFILDCLAVDPAKRATANSLLTHPYLIDLKGLSPKNNAEQEGDEPSAAVAKAYAAAVEAKRASEEALRMLAEQQKRADSAADACRALEAPLKSANKELDLAQWAINEFELQFDDAKAASEAEDEALKKARANHTTALGKVAKARAPFKLAKKTALAEAEKATAAAAIASQKNHEADEAWQALEELKSASGADLAKWNFRNNPDGMERVDPDLETVIDIFVEHYYRGADGEFLNATDMHDRAIANLAEQLGLELYLVSGAVYAALMEKRTGGMNATKKPGRIASIMTRSPLTARRKIAPPPRRNSGTLKNAMKRRSAVTEIKGVGEGRRPPPPPLRKL